MGANRSFGHTEEPLTAASVAQLCLGLENAQHNVSAISCVLCMQDISAVSAQHVCAPTQHPSAVYGQGSDGVWVLDVLWC